MRQAFLLTLVLMLPNAVFAGTQSIIGTDDRVLLRDVCDDEIFKADEYKKLARSICVIVKREFVEEVWATGGVPVPYPGGGVEAEIAGELHEWISSEYPSGAPGSIPVSPNFLFRDEPVLKGVVGTGVLVGKRQILTAAHLFWGKNAQGSYYDQNGEPNQLNPGDYCAIFGWMGTSASEKTWGVKEFPDPYFHFRIDGFEKWNGADINMPYIPGTLSKMDLAVVRTDRIAERDILPLTIYDSNDAMDILAGKELFAVGHSLSLPLVFCDNGYVNTSIGYVDVKDKMHNLTLSPSNPLTISQFDKLLFTSLDLFSGGSGGPVLVKDRELDWRVVGIASLAGLDLAVTDGNLVEQSYTTEQFQNMETALAIQLLNDLWFPSDCYDDCDYLLAETEHEVRPILRGQEIPVTLPVGFPSGVYLVRYNASTAVRVSYVNGYATPRVARGRVSAGASYDVKLVNYRDVIVHSFGISNVVQMADVVIRASVVEADLSLYGVSEDDLDVVACGASGAIPRHVTFVPSIPAWHSEPTAFLWDFGDGNTSTSMYPTHRYTSPGTYDVSLTVTQPGRTRSCVKQGCVEVSNSYSSFEDIDQVYQQEEIGIYGVIRGTEPSQTTVTSGGDIVIYPETLIEQGKELTLKTE